MTAVIEIENGLVSRVERKVQYQVPLKDWLDKLEKRNPLNTPVLPVGTRAVYWDQVNLADQKLVVLIEQQPQVIPMTFQGTVHHLSIPYSRFFFYLSTSDPQDSMAWRMQDYRVFWAKSQYNDPAATDMIRALLPNVYDDGRICFGATSADMNQTLAQRLNQTVNEFYVSNFNRDLTIRRPDGARTWRQWERMTEKDPTGWMKWSDWDPTQSNHTRFSYDLLMAATRTRTLQVARTEFMVSPDAIPEVPLGATFGRLSEWLDGLDNSQRDRLLQAMLRDRALNNERYETPAEDEEDEEVLEAIAQVPV